MSTFGFRNHSVDKLSFVAETKGPSSGHYHGFHIGANGSRSLNKVNVCFGADCCRLTYRNAGHMALSYLGLEVKWLHRRSHNMDYLHQSPLHRSSGQSPIEPELSDDAPRFVTSVQQIPVAGSRNDLGL
jgi:hypothetical protein